MMTVMRLALPPIALTELIDICPAAAGELFRGYTKVLTESRVKN